MDNLKKIQQINQILCDAEQEVWDTVSKLVHTHSQITGLKMSCCVVPSSYSNQPSSQIPVAVTLAKTEPEKANKGHIWIPVGSFPNLKINAFNPTAKKLIKDSVVKLKNGNIFTVSKCNKLVCEGSVVLSWGVQDASISYENIEFISDSICKHIVQTQANKIKAIAKKFCTII